MILLSCNVPLRVEKCNLEYGTIELFSNHTYYYNLGDMRGISQGKWKKKGDTLILNSKYSEDKIKNIRIKKSLSDTSDVCVINIKNFNQDFMFGSRLIMDGYGDTLNFLNENVVISKNKKKYLSVILAWHRHGKVKYAISDKFEIELKADTINIFIDYTNAVLNYHFYSDEKFVLQK